MSHVQFIAWIKSIYPGQFLESLQSHIYIVQYMKCYE